MRFEAVGFSAVECDRARAVPVTPALYVNARFDAVKALCTYRHFYIRPLLQGLLAQTRRERTIIDVHYRLAALALSLLRLGGTIHFQSLAGTARSIFEVGMDLALIAKDKTDESIERFHAFREVERYQWSEQIVRFYAEREDPKDFSIAQHRGHTADATWTKTVDSLLLKYWNKRPDKRGFRRYPRDWTDSSTWQRAVSLGWEERHVRNYKVLSWYVHGSTVGTEGLPREFYDIIAAQAYLVAESVLLDTYEILGRELRLSSTDHWEARLEFLRALSALALVNDRLALLGEPSRLHYLEPHEAEWLAPLLAPGKP